MTPKTLNSKLLREFIKRAGDVLDGEWLLVGGTLLPAVGLDIRSTVDIDLIGLGAKKNDQTLALMNLAESLGLPVETPNQAAAFFLKKIPYGKSDLLPLHQGRSAKIYRPSVALYWALKAGRLSETDLVDCQHYYQYCVGQKDRIEPQGIRKRLLLALKSAAEEKKTRLKTLLDLLP